jgi:hypothetical protein
MHMTITHQIPLDLKKITTMKKLLPLLALGFMSLGSHAQVTNGLAARYEFTFGSLLDKTGNTTATNTGATLATDRFGRANCAYYFDGSSYIVVPHTSAIDLDQMGEYSIAFWVNPDVVSTGGLAAMVTKWNGSTNEQYGAWQNNDGVTVGTRTVNAVGLTSPSTLQVGTWTHIVCTYEVATGLQKIYANGTEIYTATLSTSINACTATTSLSFGAQYNDANGSGASPNRFFSGALDDISIYNRALSATEVGTLYNAEEPLCQNFSALLLATTPSSGSDGTISFVPNGGFAPYTYTVNGGPSANLASSSVCGYTYEGGSFTINAPANQTFTSVNFASYGNSQGTCGNFYYTQCNAANSMNVVEDSLLGNATATINANNGIFGDPCFGNGKHMDVQASTSENGMVSNLAAGNYSLVISDSIGCQSALIVNITNTIGVSELEKHSLRVFPNPAEENIRLHTDAEMQHAEIISVDGKVIQSEQQFNASKSIYIGDLNTGIYFVRVVFKDGSVSTQRFLKN